jgi:membrane-bound lytic murein transglycosylase B
MTNSPFSVVLTESDSPSRASFEELPFDEPFSGSIFVTEPKDQHAYLVYGNFCTLMRYNPSFKYALSVGALADAIRL